jgi:K+-transporting ATPase KdpF subunit
MILGLAMSGDDLVGIIVSAAVLIYLVYALIFPEKL